MIIKYVLPLVAAAGLAFGIYSVVQARQLPPPSGPLVPPPVRPREFKSIAGAGLIEARMENIPIGSPVSGLVWEVYVKIRDQVRKGQPLFRIDDRSLQAELKVREATLESARASLARLRAAPQLSDIPTAQAAVDEADARMHDAEINMGRTAQLLHKQAGTKSDYDRDHYAYLAAKASLARAQADLNRIRLTWDADRRVSQAAVDQAQAMVENTRTEIDRLTVRALADGEVLQVHVRPGQLAVAVWNEPLIVLGDVKRLHVRVDIDEQDLPLFAVGARAVATLKGMPQVTFPLDFVKVEPYVIPKKSLTGDNSERVDTRVLQVIYALPDDRPIPVYVGQQMDVYLQAARLPEGVSLGYDPRTRKPFEDEPAIAAAPGAKAEKPVQ